MGVSRAVHVFGACLNVLHQTKEMRLALGQTCLQRLDIR